MIKNGFKKAGIIGNKYILDEKENTLKLVY